MSGPIAGADRMASIVIVGAGLAGHAAAERLRESGFTGTLTIVGEEPHRPYNRTPLSKELLTGMATPADLALPAFTDLDATWQLGEPATSLDISTRRVTLADGRQLVYDGLVLAPGVRARHLPGAPLHTDHVHMLRTLDDAVAVERSLSRTSDRVAVVGGGFIGCELASTARARGLDVTIVDLSETLLHHGLGAALGEASASLHRDHGVRLHLGVSVQTWEPREKGIRLHLSDGELIDAEMVVVGVGTDPAQGWLAGSGLAAVTDGIQASQTCHALDTDGRPVDGIVVAGDAACWPNWRFDGIPRRVEHWINAIEMGQCAADNLLAGPDNAVPYTPTPRFWSHQHDTKIQSAGMPALGDTMNVIAGSVASRRFLAAYTRRGTDVTGAAGASRAGRDVLMGLIAFDHARELLEASPLIGRPVALPQQSGRAVA